MQRCCLSGFGSSSESSDEGEIIDDIGDVENVEGWCRQTGNVTDLSRRLSWCSCALLSSLRIKTRCSSCRWGALPASFTAPGGSCWGVFLLIPSSACSCLLPECLSSGSKEIFLFFFFFLGWEKKNSCRGTSSVPHKHTVTAEMEH